MAGKVHFARGRFHASRAPTVGGITLEEVERLRAAINEALPRIDVNVEGLCILADAIALARARVKEHEQQATRQDALAQLESMTRCTDDGLILALRACDRRTLAMVNGAQMQLIADVISAAGCFVDVDGRECRYPPSIMFAAYTRPGGFPDIYLPAGVEGVRRAVSAALATLREAPEAAGNRAKEWQRPLGRAARDALRAFTGRGDVKAWRTTGTGRRAPLVALVMIVFGFVGVELGEARALDLCREILRGK